MGFLKQQDWREICLERNPFAPSCFARTLTHLSESACAPKQVRILSR
jgi:hypothetical protein